MGSEDGFCERDQRSHYSCCVRPYVLRGVRREQLVRQLLEPLDASVRGLSTVRSDAARPTSQLRAHRQRIGLIEVTIAALVGHAKGSVTSKYIHTLDTVLIMAADTISGYIQGLLDGIEFKQTTPALDRDSRQAALARFLKRASGADSEEDDEERRLAT